MQEQERVKHMPLPDERSSLTQKISIGDLDAYVTVGMYPDGRPGEIFIKCDKEGSTVKGMLHSFAIAISLGLQYGIPLEVFSEKFKHMRFEPDGFTGDGDISYASSVVDYIFKWMEMRFDVHCQRPEVQAEQLTPPQQPPGQ